VTISLDELLNDGTTAEATDPHLISLMVAVDRLLNIGSLYPPEHAKCREVQEAFRVCVQNVASDSQQLVIECQRSGLRIQNSWIDADAAGVGVTRVQDILSTLGIARLEIAADASGMDLYNLVTTLQQQRHAADSSLKFQLLNYDSLPDSVNVIQREFGQRLGFAAGGSELGDRLKDAVSMALDGLQNEDLDPQKREIYRQVVEKFFTNVVERLETSQPMGEMDAASMSRSLDRVLELGTHAIRHAMRSLVESDGDLNELPQLFKSAEEALAYSEDRESVELMVDVLQQTTDGPEVQEPEQESEHFVGDDTAYDFSVGDLARGLAEAAPRETTVEALTAVDAGEQMAMQFHILLSDPRPSVFQRVVENLGLALTRPLSSEQREIVVSSGRRMLAGERQNLADRALPVLTAGLRKSSAAAATDFWVDICTGVDNDGLVTAWPHLVDEVIAEPQRSAAGKDKLVPLVTSMYYEQMCAEVHRLENLMALQSGRFDKRLFSSASPELYPVFAALLGTTRSKVFGELLSTGLRSGGQRDTASIVVHGLPGYRTQWRDLFQAMLLCEPGAQPSRELRALVTRAAVGLMKKLAPADRAKSWVPGLLEVLGRCGDGGGRPVLEQVLREKKFVFFAAWPAPCRERASVGLQILDQNGGGDHGSQ